VPGDREDIVLTFEPLPDPTPVAVRVRGLLKRALRSFRLKCVAIGSTPPATPTGPAPAPRYHGVREESDG
jgi:hypothetical protein